MSIKFNNYLEMVGSKKIIAEKKEQMDDIELLNAFNKKWKFNEKAGLSSLVGKKVTNVDEYKNIICFDDKLIRIPEDDFPVEVYDIASPKDKENEDRLKEKIASKYVRSAVNSARFQREKEKQDYSNKNIKEKREITKKLKSQPRFNNVQ